jgi:hypothetical protein
VDEEPRLRPKARATCQISDQVTGLWYREIGCHLIPPLVRGEVIETFCHQGRYIGVVTDMGMDSGAGKQYA